MARWTAWQVLRSGSPTPLREVDRYAAAAGLDARDRALARRLVGTELRRRGTLRALLAAFATGKPAADVTAHLRLGLAQIFFLDQVPDHAAVSETVSAVLASCGPGKGRYANAVLREALRARGQGPSGDPRRDIVGRDWHVDRSVFRDPETHPLLWAEDALSMPAPLVKRWVARLGTERAHELARLALEEAPLSVRSVAGDATDELLEGLAWTPGRHRSIALLDAADTGALLASAAFVEGRLAVQGETALRAAELVGAAPGERVLDLCAAPGGKALVLAGQGARVVALDVRPSRLARVAAELARLAPAGSVERVASDGTRGLRGASFDAVLVDAPCSNTGVLAQRPGARWRFTPSLLARLTALQARLLGEGAAAVRVGGRLVYATCSIEPVENRRQVDALLAAEPGRFELEEELEALPGTRERGGPTDGGYAARMRRVR